MQSDSLHVLLVDPWIMSVTQMIWEWFMQMLHWVTPQQEERAMKQPRAAHFPFRLNSMPNFWSAWSLALISFYPATARLWNVQINRSPLVFRPHPLKCLMFSLLENFAIVGDCVLSRRLSSSSIWLKNSEGSWSAVNCQWMKPLIDVLRVSIVLWKKNGLGRTLWSSCCKTLKRQRRRRLL